MVAGALIGTVIGGVVADNAEDAATASSTMVIPAYTGDQISLNFYHQF